MSSTTAPPDWEKLYLDLKTKYDDLRTRYTTMLAIFSDGGLQMMVIAKQNALPPESLPIKT